MKDERRILQKQIEKFERDLFEIGEAIELAKKRVEEHKVLIRALQYRLDKLLAE